MTDNDAAPPPSAPAVLAPPLSAAAARRARLRELSPKTMWLTAAVIAVLTAGAVVVLWWAATRGLNGAELVTARLDALKIGLSIGVGSGGVVALYLSWRRQDSTERTLAHQQEVHTATMAHQDRVATATERDAAQRRLNELYLKAVEQLGSAEAAVRHGGLYALEQVAHDDPKRRQTVVNVICAYLRSPFTPPPDTAGTRRLGARRPLLKSADRSRVPASPSYGGTRQAQVQEREVRLTAQRILHQHLQPGEDPDHPRSDFWPGISIDLTGATLLDFSLANCTVATASFRRATFTGTATFETAKFSGDTGFEEAEFGGDTGFEEAEFGGYAGFSGVEFCGGAWFVRAKFGGDAVFVGAGFGVDTVFDGAEFSGTPWFDGAQFSGSVRFNGAKFSGSARFGEANFSGLAWFREAKFSGAAWFDGAMFGDAGFGRAKFCGAAWFGRAKFGDAEFREAEFCGEVEFGRAEFGGSTSFDGAVYDGGRAFDPAEHGVPQCADEPDPAGGPSTT
ncbi:pentapeptide repeat-containing protein [Amycolatopsis sp. NPDC003861]